MFLIFFHNACERILSDVCKNKITMSFQKNLFTWRFKKISAWCSKKLFCWCCYVLKRFWVMTWCFLEKKSWCEDFRFKGGGWRTFFRFTLKAFISIRVTLGIIQNDYFDHVRHVWDIFGTIRSLKIIFWDYIFENFRLKMNKNTFFGILWLYKGNYYLFKLRNEEFRCLRSEYMTIIIS